MVASCGRRVLIVVATVIVLAGYDVVTVMARQDQVTQDTLALRRMREWVSAVEAHTPGQVDAAMIAVGGWTDDRLRTLQADLARFLRRDPPIEASMLKLDVREIRERILRRGAMLHADVAMLTPTTPPAGAASDDRSTQPSGVLINDGLPGRLTAFSFHWSLGRQLLGALPAPSDDAFVDLWYRATTAVLIAAADYATVERHLLQAQRVLPNKAHVWLASSVPHAYFARPPVQHAASRVRIPPSSELLVQDERRELAQAQRHLERALNLDSANAEARLRLGRVLALRQKHDEALRELRTATALVKEPIQQYYVHLFSGQVESELGRREDARVSFERAAALFPGAQTPRLALSELAAKGGDAAAALAALQPSPAAARDARDDPWWTYDEAYARDWPALVARLRAWFSTETR
jgi:tetratricopeptide (TPR) repeat protein